MKNPRVWLVIFFSFFNINYCCAAPIPVGASYGGGTVFCVSQTPDITKCITEGSGNYGMIMANEDQVNFDSPENGVIWASERRDTGAVSDNDGRANTAAIIAASPEDNPNDNAAWVCHNYRDRERHTDWYLPSTNELNKMYIYARTYGLIGRNCVGSKPGGIQCLIGGDDESYWSSTEFPSYYSDDACGQQFSDGFQFVGGKGYSYFGVRAVRAFNNSTIQPFNNLQMPQIRQVVERFIHDAEETGNADIAKLQEMFQGIPDARIILLVFEWLKTDRTIKILNLANVDLRDLIEPLCDLLTVRADFTTINLTNCNLDAVSIRRLLQNCRELRTLYLGWNNIGNKVAETLAEMLQNNPALTILDLGANSIGLIGANVLVRILQNNTTLTTLNLNNNQIGKYGVKELAGRLRYNGKLTTIYLGWNNIDGYGVKSLIEALQHNPTLIIYDIHNNGISNELVKALNEAYNNKILVKLLRKIKRASSFTFMIANRHTILSDLLPNILEYAGLNVRNRTAFEDVRDYDTGENRRIIFGGTLEEVVRLFYHGDHADYAETIREVNQLRREQREFLQINWQAIPAGQLLELPENLPGVGGATLTPERVAAAFWTVS